MVAPSVLARGILAASSLGISSRATGSAGCGTTHWFPGITKYHSVTSSNRSRDYSIHLPSSYDANHPYPVVLGFHGSSSVGFFLEVDSKLSESRFSGDKIMVYPNGLDGAWAGPSYSNTSLAEDITFVGDLITEVQNNYCVDVTRMYATGLSNGGGFVGSLACDASVGGKFAAFAIAAGSFYTDLNGPDNGCTPARSPLPILEFHGGNDKSVFYAGGEGEGGELPAISDWISSWATRNGCTSPPAQNDTFDGDVHHFSWTCQGVDGVLQHYKVDSMGHVWPSTEPNFSQLAALEGPTHIQASSILMDFFDKFARTA
ncbi:Carbohydrate esterase family 1 protein [Mycena kentingensis (nom. inval.)]|nr:Carbohydrate esterase family 1 protein [Mycena kentingensis (nom. inval.)]